MKFQDVLTGVFILILVYLLATNWQAANNLLISSVRGSNTLIRTLQGR